ncbi:unnamed protein product [Closterium sp. Naga37s-1]|nr:unnamed protein product [Closterium sp. Naga37s-1]
MPALHRPRPSIAASPSLGSRVPLHPRTRHVAARVHSGGGAADAAPGAAQSEVVAFDAPKSIPGMMELRQLLTHDPVGGWDKAWQASTTPWDLGGVTPAVAALVAAQEGSPLHLPPSIRRVLVPGCSTGYDVEVLASDGREATALDISPAAVVHAEKRRWACVAWVRHQRPPLALLDEHNSHKRVDSACAASTTPIRPSLLHPSLCSHPCPPTLFHSSPVAQLPTCPIAPAMPLTPSCPRAPSLHVPHAPSLMHRPSMSLHGSHRVQVLLCAGAIAEGQDSRAARITLMFPIDGHEGGPPYAVSKDSACHLFILCQWQGAAGQVGAASKV